MGVISNGTTLLDAGALDSGVATGAMTLLSTSTASRTKPPDVRAETLGRKSWFCNDKSFKSIDIISVTGIGIILGEVSDVETIADCKGLVSFNNLISWDAWSLNHQYIRLKIDVVQTDTLNTYIFRSNSLITVKYGHMLVQTLV